MKRLIDAIIKKWFCCHEWEFQYKENVEVGFDGRFCVHHYFCKKCGKYKRVKTY